LAEDQAEGFSEGLQPLAEDQAMFRIQPLAEDDCEIRWTASISAKL